MRAKYAAYGTAVAMKQSTQIAWLVITTSAHRIMLMATNLVGALGHVDAVSMTRVSVMCGVVFWL